MDQGIKETVERNKALAEALLQENKPAFIKDTDDNIYFCDILLVGDTTVRVLCFGPEQRKGKKFTLYWALVDRVREYEGREEGR